jgi:hypothetical protein
MFFKKPKTFLQTIKTEFTSFALVNTVEFNILGQNNQYILLQRRKVLSNNRKKIAKKVRFTDSFDLRLNFITMNLIYLVCIFDNVESVDLVEKYLELDKECSKYIQKYYYSEDYCKIFSFIQEYIRSKIF